MLVVMGNLYIHIHINAYTYAHVHSITLSFFEKPKLLFISKLLSDITVHKKQIFCYTFVRLLIRYSTASQQHIVLVCVALCNAIVCHLIIISYTSEKINESVPDI